MNFNKILICLDRNADRLTPVFERGLRLAEKEGSSLMLFHVVRQETLAELEDRVGTMSELNPTPALEQQGRRRRQELEHIRAWLDGLCGQAADQGVSARSAVEVGSPGPALVEMARNWGADLIVLGRTRRSAWGDVLKGGVSHHVVHNAPCSVLFVHEDLSPTD
ncbi:MAG: universal stress protein [Pseudomonadota bacterium]